MHRRALLQQTAAAALAAPLGAVLTGGGAAGAAVQGYRRVRPGELGWPSAERWLALKQAVGGNLVEPISVYGNCEIAGQVQACEAEMRLLRNQFYLGDQPGAVQFYGWLDAWTVKLSAYGVVAHTTADVVAAVTFARAHKLRLVVKGGGHSYQGTSNAADSLLVWTRAMNQVELHDGFVPEGCEGVMKPQTAVSVEAGAMWIDVYDAVTTKAGRYAQGGGCTTVGVAGHIQSGGFGSYSKGFGTAAGNLLEAEVVTADGQIRIANARRNPDLFWALKGGGGGSFGVVTRVTVRTYDLPEFFGDGDGVIKATSDEAYRRLIDQFMAFYAERLFNPHWGEQASFQRDNTLKLSMVCHGLNQAQVEETWAPFIAWVRAAPQDYKELEGLDVGVGQARGMWDVVGRRKRGSDAMVADDRPDAPAHHAVWKGDAEQAFAFVHGYESLWLPAVLLKPEQRPKLVDALFAASRHMDVQLHFNKGMGGAEPEAIAGAADTATNPAVLDAFALAIVSTGGLAPLPGLPVAAPDMSLAHRDAQAIDRANAELIKVAPTGASYVSESNYFNPNWSHACWGENYARLRTIKDKYDPDGLFFVHHGVGSEDWSPDGFVRKS